MVNSTRSLSPRSTALISFLLTLPIGILFTSILFDIKPTEILLKSILTDDGNQPNSLGYAYMGLGLLALPVAIVVGLWPMLQKGKGGKHYVYIWNLIVVSLPLIIAIHIFGAFADEIYRCDILRIPNCD